MNSPAKTLDIAHAFRANQEILRVLEASKALSENIVDTLPIVLVMVDDERRILKVNLEGQRIFRCSEAEILGSDVGTLFPQESSPQIQDYFAQNVRGRRVFEEQLDAFGETRFFHWLMCPVYQGGDEARRIHVIIGSDTSDARAAHANLVALRKDLEVAGAVQSMLLPPHRVRDESFFRIAAHYEPSSQVGGDLWWYLVVPGHGVLSIVADAMGHGAGSALAAATVCGALHAFARSSEIRSGADVTRLISDLNRTIAVTFQGRFMVAIGAVWVPANEPFVDIVSAGFPAMLMQPANEPAMSLISFGDPAGLDFTNFRASSRRFPMKEGDRLVCFTDGCYEFLHQGKPLRKRGLQKLFETVRHLAPSDACTAAAAELRRLRGTDYAEDDVTFVMVDRR